MCHAPADCFHVDQRGYLDEGYWADVVIVDPEAKWTVQKDNIYYKCNWSPFEGQVFTGKVESTIVSGHLAYQNGQFFEDKKGERLLFNHE
jgi:dihydroorotase